MLVCIVLGMCVWWDFVGGLVCCVVLCSWVMYIECWRLIWVGVIWVLNWVVMMWWWWLCYLCCWIGWVCVVIVIVWLICLGIVCDSVLVWVLCSGDWCLWSCVCVVCWLGVCVCSLFFFLCGWCWWGFGGSVVDSFCWLMLVWDGGLSDLLDGCVGVFWVLILCVILCWLLNLVIVWWWWSCLFWWCVKIFVCFVGYLFLWVICSGVVIFFYWMW